jgi:hypothetical protein
MHISNVRNPNLVVQTRRFWAVEPKKHPQLCTRPLCGRRRKKRKKKKKRKKRKEKETKKWRGKERKKILGDVFWFFVFFIGLCDSSRGRRVFLTGEKKDTVLYEFFYKKKKKKMIFSFKEGILVTLHPKTTSFWVFHQFSLFQLTKGAIL